MTSPLERLTGTGKPLAAESPDAKEFEGLKRSGLARLKDATNTANSLESRFDLAYNAAHALSLAALRCKGFRPHPPGLSCAACQGGVSFSCIDLIATF